MWVVERGFGCACTYTTQLIPGFNRVSRKAVKRIICRKPSSKCSKGAHSIGQLLINKIFPYIYLPRWSLSNGESHRSLAVCVLQLFYSRSPIFFFETHSSWDESFLLNFVLKRPYFEYKNKNKNWKICRKPFDVTYFESCRTFERLMFF
jgi:hypothetical protein